LLERLHRLSPDRFGLGRQERKEGGGGLLVGELPEHRQSALAESDVGLHGEPRHVFGGEVLDRGERAQDLVALGVGLPLAAAQRGEEAFGRGRASFNGPHGWSTWIQCRDRSGESEVGSWKSEVGNRESQGKGRAERVRQITGSRRGAEVVDFVSARV